MQLNTCYFDNVFFEDQIIVITDVEIQVYNIYECVQIAFVNCPRVAFFAPPASVSF